MKSINLAYREGGSDKVYQATIQPEGDKFLVNFAYGRRGNALTTGTKTTSPVDIESANRIFDKLVKEKTSKGYTIEGGIISPDMSEYNGVANIQVVEKKDTGMRAQLLNDIDEEMAMKLIEDDLYMAQEKFDGRRMMISKLNGKIICANRKGQEIQLPAEFEAIGNIPRDFEIDGENMGSYFAAFDMLSLGGYSTKGAPAQERIKLLMENMTSGFPAVQVVYTAITTEAKRALYKQLVVDKKEGIVFKMKQSSYVPGRPYSKGTHLKFKFYATASFVVLGINDKRSVLLSLWDKNVNAYLATGNCTIPVNHEIPKVGDVVEAKYLYAFRESGNVYQPSYLGKREDVDAIECTTEQLKYKPETQED